MPAPDRTSRYWGLATIQVTAADGSVRTLGAPRVVPEPRRRGTYEVTGVTRLDLLGHLATGDTTRWWVLADANPWPDATRLERPGQVLELPDA